MKQAGFALLIVLMALSGLLVCAGLVLQHATRSYLVAQAQYRAYQRYYEATAVDTAPVPHVQV